MVDPNPPGGKILTKNHTLGHSYYYPTRHKKNRAELWIRSEAPGKI